MHRTMSERRHNNIKKALRKRNICKHNYGFNYYDNLHQYSKNKIHCSCPMCAAKTNAKLNKSKGPLSSNRRFYRLAVTNKRYGKKNYKISEIKQIDKMKYNEE